MQRKVAKPKRPHWWAKGWVLDKNGRMKELIIGHFNSEMECRDEAIRTFLGDFDVQEFPTINENRAGHYFRHFKMQQGASPAEALERFRHRGKDLVLPE